MEITQCIIQGADPKSLITILRDQLSDSYLYSSDQISVITTEKYFFRTNSNLVTTIIIEYKDKSSINIEIISGGGGSGLLQMGWGSEGSANNKIMKFLKQTCETHSWHIQEQETKNQTTDYDL